MILKLLFVVRKSHTTRSMRNLLLLSSSNVHGYEFLQYAADDIKYFLKKNKAKKILFIPYASPDHEKYFEKVDKVFSKWGFTVDSCHKYYNPQKVVQEAEAFFVGGGNTFLLLYTLYHHKLIHLIRKRVLEDGKPYIGTSAGTNVATVSINTTNDMPIIYPPSFEALRLVPFNINPHYLDPDTSTKHKGETREERILQYLEVGAGDKSVLAMREGVHLLVEDDKATLMGLNSSRLYIKNQLPQELPSGSDVSYLLESEKENAKVKTHFKCTKSE